MKTAPTTARPARGMTLVELLLALVIVALLSTTTAALLAGASNSNRFMLGQATAMSEVDSAVRRIIYNLRTASAAPAWSSTSHTLSITKTGVGTITYSVDASGNLVESDPRYNAGAAPNILIHGVTAAGFSCKITPPGGTAANTLVALDLVMPATQTVERHLTIAVRGF